MPSVPTSPFRPLPLWLRIAGSAFAVGHLLVIGVYALAATSGPWPTPYGASYPADPPRFASTISMNLTYPYYLEPLRMTHNYHFASNRPADFAANFEVQLKNEFGEIKKFKFPDEKANFWVRHRQEILAQHLAADMPLPQRGNQRVGPGGGKDLPKVEIWVREDASTLRLKEVEELDPVLRNPDVLQPAKRAKLLAGSYARYQCRLHKAASAEVIRHSRMTVMPMYVLQPRPDLFTDLKSYFGEIRCD